MVKVNDFGVTFDGHHLVIDIHVRDLMCFKEEVTVDVDGEEQTKLIDKVFLDKIYVVNHHQFSDGDSYKTNYLYKIEYGEDDHVTTTREFIGDDEIPTMSTDLLFLIVETKGEPSGNYRGMNPTVAATYYEERVYQDFMDGMKEVAEKDSNNCMPPRWLIDMQLRLKALQVAIESCDWKLACKWWREMFEGGGEEKKKCNCHA